MVIKQLLEDATHELGIHHILEYDISKNYTVVKE